MKKKKKTRHKRPTRNKHEENKIRLSEVKITVENRVSKTRKEKKKKKAIQEISDKLYAIHHLFTYFMFPACMHAYARLEQPAWQGREYFTSAGMDACDIAPGMEMRLLTLPKLTVILNSFVCVTMCCEKGNEPVRKQTTLPPPDACAMWIS